MTRGKFIRLPLWLVFGMALGLALGPLADSLRLAVFPHTAWAAAGPTASKWAAAVAAGGTLTTTSSSVYGDTTTCDGTNANFDTSANSGAGKYATYNTFLFTALDVPLNSTIDSITVTLVANLSSGGTGGSTWTLQLVNGSGALVGVTQSTAALTTTTPPAVFTLGGAMSTWGSPALAQTDIVSTSFGVRVTAGGNKNNLYCLRVQVSYTPPANIQIRDLDQGYAQTGITGSLTAAFTQNTQTIYAGYIDVTNLLNLLYGNFDSGYTLVNVVDDTSLPADAALNSVLKVAINAVSTITSCDAVSGTTVPTQGAAVITQASNTTWVGSLIPTPRTTINTNGAAERLCFYLILNSAPDTIAGGSLQYNLTFTAN